MDKPYFSVVIPTLNEEKYLPRLLTDLTRQTCKDFEVVIVDSRSIDKTKERALTFSPQLPLNFFSVTKRNVSYQRNFGAKKARGFIVVFFDADSQIPKDFLEKVKSAFEGNNSDSLTTWMKPDSKDEREIALSRVINIGCEMAKFLHTPVINGAMMAIKKDIVLELAGFDETLRFGEDTDFIRKLVKRGYSFEILRKCYYQYSFRRFRKEGVLETIRKSALLNLSVWLNNDKLAEKLTYPMGGHNFKGKAKPRSFQLLNENLHLFSQFTNTKTRKPKAMEFLKKLLSDLKDYWESE